MKKALYTLGLAGTLALAACPSGEACVVTCSGEDACRGMTLDATAAASLDLRCSGEQACHSMTVRGPTAPGAQRVFVPRPRRYRCRCWHRRPSSAAGQSRYAQSRPIRCWPGRRWSAQSARRERWCRRRSQQVPLRTARSRLRIRWPRRRSRCRGQPRHRPARSRGRRQKRPMKRRFAGRAHPIAWSAGLP